MVTIPDALFQRILSVLPPKLRLEVEQEARVDVFTDAMERQEVEKQEPRMFGQSVYVPGKTTKRSDGTLGRFG